MNPAITTTTTYKDDNNNSPSSYIQIKPNKLVRAELLKNDFSQPKYIRTKPNVIVRAEVANNFNGKHPKHPNSYSSHKKSPHVIPYCRHFSHGLCINRKCHYTHVRVNPKASRCEAFIKERYCPKGFDCREKHEWSFPIFDDDEIEEAKKRKWDDSEDSNDEFKKDQKEESSKPKIRVKQEWENVNEFSDGGFDFIPFEYSYEKKSKLNSLKSPLKKLKSHQLPDLVLYNKNLNNYGRFFTQVNASTIKLKSTFWSSAVGDAWIINCDNQEVVSHLSNLKFTSDQSECLVFSTSTSLSKYCLHIVIYKNAHDEDNIDNSQDTCYEVDGYEAGWSLSKIDCGQIPSNITACNK
ncbi:724_t:CDS:2 [Diversispora eburnea]|uniref:724_t:CDS:1 n=1 Tax=Diversispora eburnea TaxID=1213867 RepID=A0A9N9FPR1_9GLOM|nr:724_t:CDS:2 [Diversispora eburnea]